jgi:hypothetical protein
VLDDQETRAVQIPGSDGDGERWWWPVMVRSKVGESEQRAIRCKCEGKGENVEENLCHATRGRIRS